MSFLKKTTSGSKSLASKRNPFSEMAPQKEPGIARLDFKTYFSGIVQST
jgi:hypothetical protein